jgi:mono-ADP-ribosyltransferase sirtuin 6
MDALHRRSGLPSHLINEQHGDKHKERCERCGMEFFRQYDTLETVMSSRSHLTGRNCTFCGGRLRDTIVHFSEPVKPEDMLLAMYHARKCDLAVVLGYLEIFFKMLKVIAISNFFFSEIEQA